MITFSLSTCLRPPRHRALTGIGGSALPGTFEKQDGMLSKFYFDTLALLKRRENAAQIFIFILWPGHSLEHPKVRKNHIKIHPKSTKNHQELVLGVALGAPGLPLEASWAPLGAQMPKTIKKVTWRTPPRGCQRRSFWAPVCDILSNFEDLVVVFCRLVFWRAFGTLPGPPHVAPVR